MKRDFKHMKKIFWIVGGSVFLVAAIMFGAFFAGPLFASAHTGQPTTAATSTPTTTTNTYCEQYLQDLAKRLGVSVSTLQQDKLSAREDVLAQMVKDGKLTQSQATAIEQKLQSHQACTGKGNGVGRGIVLGSLKQYLPAIENQVAQGLKLTSSQLTTDLKNGQSLNQVATAQGVSSSQLHTIALNAVQSAVNQAVKDGNLTQTQATDFMTALQQHPALLDSLFNRHLHAKA
jgi:polyhydroxyalkanoate synthesis regulator phasin